MAHLEFRALEEFPGYRFGNDGTVQSCWRAKKGVGQYLSDIWRDLSPSTCCGGMPYKKIIIVDKSGVRKTRLVHRMVLFAFRGVPTEGYHGRHLNGKCRDNRLENLAWGSSLENYDDRRRHGTDDVGERNGRSLVTEQQVREIRQRRADGASYAQITSEVSILSKGQIECICRREAWKHVK